MFSIKILSGLMYGVDITLPAEDLFFIVAPARAEAESIEHVAERAANTLFIPAGEGAPNFMLGLAATEGLEAQVFHETGVERLSLTLNQPVRLGEVWLAVKPQAEAWSSEVLAFINGGTGAAPSKPQRWAARMAPVGLALLVMAVASWGVASAFESRPGQTLARLVEPLNAQVLDGRDGLHYVWAASPREAGWARQAVARQGLAAEKVRVLSPESERSRLTQLLERDAIDFVALRLDDPTHPVLLLGEAHVAADSEARRESIRHLLHEAAPYAEAVEIRFVAETQVRQRARELLTQAAVPFEERLEGNAYVFLIRAALDDRQLAEMNSGLRSFRHLWGDSLVRFMLRLDEDPLRGKTFRSGTAGYLLERDKHWVYSREQEGQITFAGS